MSFDPMPLALYMLYWQYNIYNAKSLREVWQKQNGKMWDFFPKSAMIKLLELMIDGKRGNNSMQVLVDHQWWASGG